MSYYYVRHDGAATLDAGRAATPRTGPFDSMGVAGFYSSIYDVFNGAVPSTAPASGDIIVVSSDHDHTYAATTTIGIKAGVLVLSADDANADAYQRGAWERTVAAGRDLTLCSTETSEMAVMGVSLQCADDLLIRTSRRSITISDCEIWSSGAKSILLDFDGERASFDDVDFRFGSAGASIAVGGGSSVKIRGGSILTNLTHVFSNTGGGGARISADSFDMSACTGDIFEGTTINHDVVDIDLNRCKIGSGLIATSSSTKAVLKNRGVSMWSCDTGDGYHYFRSNRQYGESGEEVSIYRTSGATYDGVNGFCVEMVTESTASYMTPLSFDIFNGWIDTGDFTSTITATVHFATNDAGMAVDSSKVWFEFEFADGADNALGVVATNRGGPLAVGAAPTVETGLWTGLDGTDQQLSMGVTATIGTTAGTMASGMVRVRAFLASASEAVFVCPQVEFS